MKKGALNTLQLLVLLATVGIVLVVGIGTLAGSIKTTSSTIIEVEDDYIQTPIN